ncbi:hypothetical protein Tsp_11998 [Trichinella spiralis]|uniref:hypothetical protein n=1 Tax=Trichinella spiralis TaxID=6334 RepID=UPI0001EFCD8D|nr:hypothetical protein Tsp_11998 [Trichinella spiralis]
MYLLQSNKDTQTTHASKKLLLPQLYTHAVTENLPTVDSLYSCFYVLLEFVTSSPHDGGTPSTIANSNSRNFFVSHIISPIATFNRTDLAIQSTFIHQANESGLYGLDSPWPTEYEHTPSTAANRESVDTTGPNDSMRIDGYANDKLGQPMNGSLKAGELAIYGADLNHRRLMV